MLGSIADKRLDEALQDLLDQGFLGDFTSGTPWYEVIDAPNLKLESPPEYDDLLLSELFSRWKEAEAKCVELSMQKALTQSDLDDLALVKQKYDVAKKLVTESPTA